MSEPNETATPLPESSYQVTHFVRPAGNRESWAQHTSAETDAAGAMAFVTQREADHARQLANLPASTVQPDPTQLPQAAVEATADSVSSPAESVSAPDSGE